MSAHTTIHPQPHGSPGMSRFSDMKKKLVKKMEDFMTAGDRVNPTEEQLELAGQIVHSKDPTRYTEIPFGSIIRQNPAQEGQMEMMVTAFDVLFRYTVNMLKLKRPRNWHTIKFSNAQFKARADCMIGTRNILKLMGYTNPIVAEDGSQSGLSYPDPTQINHDGIKIIGAELLTAKFEVKTAQEQRGFSYPLPMENVQLDNPHANQPMRHPQFEPDYYSSIPQHSTHFQPSPTARPIASSEMYSNYDSMSYSSQYGNPQTLTQHGSYQPPSSNYQPPSSSYQPASSGYQSSSSSYGQPSVQLHNQQFDYRHRDQFGYQSNYQSSNQSSESTTYFETPTSSLYSSNVKLVALRKKKEDLLAKFSQPSSIKQQSNSDPASSDTTSDLFTCYNNGEHNVVSQLGQDFAELQDQMKQLQVRQSSFVENGTANTTTVNRLHQNSNEMERKVQRIEEMVKSNIENIETANINANGAFQKALDIQKDNEQLKESNGYLQKQLLDVQKRNGNLETTNADLKNQLSVIQQQFMDVQKSNKELKSALQNQLSLTQQHLLGVQSMLICSRLWVVSHDHFTIEKEIGRGAWATVHKATFRGATVAAKCLHKVITTPATRQLFQREMEMALQCQHQHIVTFLGATLEGALVILMELMDTSLRNGYEEDRVKNHQMCGILQDVAKALYFLHTRPGTVIHRDVSSANVLLKVLYNDEWLAKLGDLGTAKMQQQAATAGPGAIAYGAPEAANFRLHSPKMDVYSFGVLTLELLTKTHPFQMVDALKLQVQQQHPLYNQLVTRCTKEQLSDRPTMCEVLVELDSIAAIK